VGFAVVAPVAVIVALPVPLAVPLGPGVGLALIRLLSPTLSVRLALVGLLTAGVGLVLVGLLSAVIRLVLIGLLSPALSVRLARVRFVTPGVRLGGSRVLGVGFGGLGASVVGWRVGGGGLAGGPLLQEVQPGGDVLDHPVRLIGDLAGPVGRLGGDARPGQDPRDARFGLPQLDGRPFRLPQQLADQLGIHAVELAHGPLPDVAAPDFTVGPPPPAAQAG